MALLAPPLRAGTRGHVLALATPSPVPALPAGLTRRRIRTCHAATAAWRRQSLYDLHRHILL